MSLEGPGIQFHEGRISSYRPVNVELQLFHEGRGAGKSTTPGGREKHAYFLKRAGDGLQGGAPVYESSADRVDAREATTFHLLRPIDSRLIY